MATLAEELRAEIRAGFARHEALTAELIQAFRLVMDGLDTLNARISSLESRTADRLDDLASAVDDATGEMREAAQIGDGEES